MGIFTRNVHPYVQKAAVLFITMSILGCGKKPEIRGRDIDSRLAPYVTEFEAEFSAAVNFPISISPLPGNLAGVCSTNVHQWGSETLVQKTVTIDQSIYDTFANYPKYLEALVFHELSHCVFDIKDHDESIISGGAMDGCPTSLMYPSTIYNCYIAFEEYYINELHTKISK